MTVLREYAAQLSQPTLPGGRDAAPARYDEVVGPDGALRPAWRGMAEVAASLTARDLRRADSDIARALADDGVTYARPGAGPGPWRLDPVPLVIDPAGWTPLEVGLAQRAELLNAVLVDLYGAQRLLAERIVPAAVVLGHGGFTRAAVRPAAVDPWPLVLTATDLGRDASGEWRVLGDKAQAPSGIGYAMENRRVISRVMPELYRQAGMHRMEPYFRALRSALLQSAAGDLADPRVVVLSPGSRSETSYDQAFLASALGFPLVQGSDLVVRDGFVHLRAPSSRGRLERVDVVLRRVDAAWSDPLELRGDSQLGVAGLTEALRRGRVKVVNGLGAGVLENPALLPYLPAACEALLDEPLRLASVPTWWCGDPAGLEQVLDRLAARDPALSLRLLDPTGDSPADSPAGSRAELTADLPRATGADLAALCDRVVAEPHRYVGQERAPLSQAPTWRSAGPYGGGTTSPQPITLRTFTLRYGSAYRPLVGGLASVVDRVDGQDRAWASKDVWVLKGDPADPDQGLTEVLPLTTGRSVTVLVPRTLEDMFWVGRYAERAEDTLRLLLSAHGLAEDFRARPRSSGGAGLAVLLRALHRWAGHGPGDDDLDGLDRDFRSLLLDGDRTGSVAHALSGLRSALAGVRDQLSGDVWRAIGATDRAAVALVESPYSHQVEESAGRMLAGVLSLQGVTASMIRDEGWHMIEVGRHLERAILLVQLLRDTTTVRHGLDVDRGILNAVLLASESAVTHRRRYRGYVRPGGVLDLLLMDPDNPRSLAFCLTTARQHLDGLAASTGSTRPERLLEDLTAALEGTEVPALVAIGGVARPNLERFLDDALAQLVKIAEAVAELHFAAGPAPRPLGVLAPLAPLESA